MESIAANISSFFKVSFIEHFSCSTFKDQQSTNPPKHTFCLMEFLKTLNKSTLDF